MEYVHSRNFTSALACFETALKQSPNNPTILMNIGNCHSELGNYEQAISHYQAAVRAGSLTADLAGNLSDAYQKSGDNDNALKWLEASCELNPALKQNARTQSLIRRLKDPMSNPKTSPESSDYYLALTQRPTWAKTAMPIRVYVERNPKLAALHPQFVQTIEACTKQWSEATLQTITFKIVDDLSQANLVCQYTDRREDVRSDHELGADSTSFVYKNKKDDKKIDAAKIVILVCEHPGAPYRGSDVVTKPSLHEIGHALGIYGHSPNNHDVMFFTANIPSVLPKLSMRDKKTIARLYASGGTQ